MKRLLLTVVLVMALAPFVVSAQPAEGLDPGLMNAATSGPHYESPEVAQKRALAIKAAKQQLEMNALAIRMNEQKLQQERQVSLYQPEERPQTAGMQPTADAARVVALEERLARLETVFAAFIDMETTRWKKQDERDAAKTPK